VNESIQSFRPAADLLILRSSGLTLVLSGSFDAQRTAEMAGALVVCYSNFTDTPLRDMLPVLMRSLREAHESGGEIF